MFFSFFFHLSAVSPVTSVEGSVTFFHKGPQSEYLRFCGPPRLCHNYVTLSPWCSCRRREYVNNSTWPCSTKTSFMDAAVCILYKFCAPCSILFFWFFYPFKTVMSMSTLGQSFWSLPGLILSLRWSVCLHVTFCSSEHILDAVKRSRYLLHPTFCPFPVFLLPSFPLCALVRALRPSSSLLCFQNKYPLPLNYIWWLHINYVNHVPFSKNWGVVIISHGNTHEMVIPLFKIKTGFKNPYIKWIQIVIISRLLFEVCILSPGDQPPNISQTRTPHRVLGAHYPAFTNGW